MTRSILPLDNVVQQYAWGSKTAIADLLGRPNSEQEPQAEMWMGTHPKGPSMVAIDGIRLPLQQVIEFAPVDILGGDTARRFDNRLPYLFKVLAADRPLSIQAHPSKIQAQAGFDRENQAGKALDAPERNYRDPNHKPEIICALTPFWGLNGFRPAREAAELLAPVCPPALEEALRDLKTSGKDAIRTFFMAMLTLSADQCRTASAEIMQRVSSLIDQSPVYRWMRDLIRAYPADMGVLSPALLNLVCLDPGQAMYLPAGQLHAYLGGVGIELMANSDNVLRGGLTPKHIDVPELLRVVRFEASAIEIVEAKPVRPAEFIYCCPAEEFVLSVMRTDAQQPYGSLAERSVEILLCTSGKGVIEASGHALGTVKQGDSFLVPAAMDSYTLHGNLTIYKATVPTPSQ